MELLLFLIGGRVYTWIEILWRGYTHWSMFILGGACFVIMGLLNEYKIPWHWCLLRQSVVSAVIITVFEFITGCVVNLWLNGEFGIILVCHLTCVARYVYIFSFCGSRFPWSGLCWMTGPGICSIYGCMNTFPGCRKGSGHIINLYKIYYERR